MKKNSIKKLLRISKKGQLKIITAGFLMFLSSICSLIPFYVAYRIIDIIVHPPYDAKAFSILSMMALIAIVLQLFFSGWAMKQSHIAAYNILYDLRVQLARKMMRLPLGYYGKTSSGVIKKVMMGDIEAIEEFLAHHMVDIASAVFLPLLMFIGLLTFNVPLAIVSIVPMLLGVMIQRLRMKIDKEETKRFFQLKSQMNVTIIDFIKGMPLIKAFNHSVFSFKRYQEDADQYRDFWMEWTQSAGGYIALYTLLMDGGILFILPLGLFMYMGHQITLTTFLMFMFMGLGFSRFMKQLNGFGSNITQISKGVEVLESIMNEDEIEDNGCERKIQQFDLKFDHVSFGYDSKRILNDVSFVAKEKTVTALVGPSGAGKTTIGRLIPRFWDVNKGRILIDQVDIRSIKTEVLMDYVSFVFQDVFMFNDSVFENIRMGDERLSYEDVVEIAKKAEAHEFILKLEKGYDTVIGTKGTYLSGGEKQRIAIARALVKDAPIIVLDEATSYADTENEEKIQKALNALLRNKTVVVIAHRLSTIQHADQILVIKDGEIVEQGNQNQLMAMEGLYKKMWNAHRTCETWSIDGMADHLKEANIC